MIRSLLFWTLFPFVLPQAIRMRNTAPRFPGAGGPREGSAGKGTPLNLLAIGDSIIAGVGAGDLSRALVGQTAEQLADRLGCRIDWAARGSIGADSNKVLHRLVPNLPEPEANLIILSVGVNDVTGLIRVSQWQRNLDDLLAALHRHSPQAIVAVAGIPPLKGFPLLPQPLRALFGLRGKIFDNSARKVVSRCPWAVYVPLEFDPTPDKFSADGYHPSEASYTMFGHMMADCITSRFQTAISPGAHPE
jgi:lysophospholipase L1-like esterase